MKKQWLIPCLCWMFLLAACGQPASQPAAQTPEPTVQASENPAEPTPTKTSPTPEPETQYVQDGVLVLPEVSPAQTPGSCAGFGALEWGEDSDGLFEENLASFAVQRGANYAGYMGSAYYMFRDDVLWHGELIYYVLPDKSDLDIYIEVRSYLIETYGEPGAETGATPLEDFVRSAEGFCAESWELSAEGGGRVRITLLLEPEKACNAGESGTSVRFTYTDGL